mgnify:CR=1 FL=1
MVFTKWCTTQEKYWNEYYKNYKLIYIIDRVNNQKYAISRKKDDELKIQGWMADDKEVNPMMLPLPSEIMTLVISEVKKKESVSDLMNCFSKELIVSTFSFFTLSSSF